MRETNFDRLLHRYLHNELTPGESKKFEAWLNLLQKENAQDLEMSEDAKEELFHKITSSITTVDEVVALYPKKTLFQKLTHESWFRVAATVLLLVAATFSVRYVMLHRGTQEGGVEKMILADGTIVWMNEPGRFSYYEKEGGRFAEFTGEALFEVAKDPSRPFTISCGRVNVRVLGTSFTLKADTAQIELNVLTGKVNVTSATDRVGVDVTPNERIVYSSAGLVARDRLADDAVRALTDNTEYNMRFQAALMDEVIDGIEKKFDVVFVVKNERITLCHVSADFTDRSLEDTLSILKDLIDVEYTITGKQIVLSGNGC